MEKVTIDAIESRMGPASVKRALAGPLGADDIALNYYELEPGESFGFGYHRHPNQEEVFLVRSGTVTFETEDGDVRVEAGDAIRFAPGEWQLGRNEGDERVVAFALGAPQEMGDTDMLRHCEACGGRTHNYVEMTDDRDALLTRCEECDTETGRFT